MPERFVSYDRIHQGLDSGFTVQAPSWQRLYIDAALAMTDLMTPLGGIQDSVGRSLEVTGGPGEELLGAWLSGILALFREEQFLCRRIVFERFDGRSIRARVHGEGYVPLRHGVVAPRTLVIGQLRIGDSGGAMESSFYARVLLRE